MDAWAVPSEETRDALAQIGAVRVHEGVAREVRRQRAERLERRGDLERRIRLRLQQYGLLLQQLLLLLLLLAVALVQAQQRAERELQGRRGGAGGRAVAARRTSQPQRQTLEAAAPLLLALAFELVARSHDATTIATGCRVWELWSRYGGTMRRVCVLQAPRRSRARASTVSSCERECVCVCVRLRGCEEVVLSERGLGLGPGPRAGP